MSKKRLNLNDFNLNYFKKIAARVGPGIAPFILSLALIFPAFFATASPSRPNLKNLDKPILLGAGPARRMYVVFNHSSHKDIACRNCHHEGLPGNRYASCVSPQCHAITSPSSREPLSVYMAYHSLRTKRSCFGCHKPLAGKYPGFKGCGPCHKSGQGLNMARGTTGRIGARD